MFIHIFQLCKIYFPCWFQVPYKIKDVELDYDNYNQVPESPIGRDEEPHLYMVPKKYRKVGLISLWFFSCLFYLLCMKISVDLFAESGHN